jgi:hypothetical protein
LEGPEGKRAHNQPEQDATQHDPPTVIPPVTDPNWQAASQAVEDLMGKLLVLRRLLEAEERLPKREPPADPT